MNGVRAADAHAIAPMVIELQADGRVRGTSPDAGCRFSGLHTPFVTPANASIDVTVSGCTDARFNTRYSGHLLVNGAAKQAKLNLSAVAMMLGRGATQATVDAVLRR
jgi:hypothetical protein